MACGAFLSLGLLLRSWYESPRPTARRVHRDHGAVVPGGGVVSAGSTMVRVGRSAIDLPAVLIGSR